MKLTSVSARALLCAVSISAFSLIHAAPASAQQNATPQDTAEAADTGDIVVTAQFRQQRLQDTPLAITAVDAATLEAKNQTNLSHVADRAPNVSLRPQGGSFGPSISASIRGVGQNDFSPAYEPGVGIYIDEVYYPQLTGAMFDLLDLERVEILRGPQGTLAGRNSEGGSIKMFSKRPDGSNTGSVEATYGSRNKIGVRASADFTIAPSLFGRISGVYKRQDGYVDVLDFGCVNPPGSAKNPANGVKPLQSAGNCKIDEMGDVGYQAVRGMLRYAPDSIDLDIMLSADYTHDQRGNAAEIVNATQTLDTVNTNPATGVPYDSRFICGPFCNYATFTHPAATGQYILAPNAQLAAYQGKNEAKYDGYNLSSQIKLGLSDMISLENIFGYGNFTATFDADDDLSPAFINAGHNRLTHWNWSEELRLNVKPMDGVTLVLGGYYFKQSTTYFSYQDIRYVPVFPLQFQQPDVVTADSKALFANASWEIMEGLNLNAGIRYTKESKVYNYFRLNLNGTINAFLDPVGAACGAGFNGVDTNDCNGNGNRTETLKALTGNKATYDGNNTDYRVALDYRFSPELMVYASVATGFKGGGTNPRPFNAFQAIGFGPEKLTSYEIGFKSDFLDRKVRLNVTGFVSDYKDVQIGVTVCPVAPPNDVPCAARVNAGDGRYKGFEVEASLRPVEGLSFDGSLSYLDFEYTRLLASAEYNATTNPGGVVKTDPPGGTPQWKWNIGGQYEIPLGGAGTLTPRFDVEYTGRIYAGVYRPTATARDLIFIPNYTLLNARVTWRNADGDLEISGEARNLTDKYYYLQLFDLRSAGAGLSKALVGSPREFALTVKKKF